MYVGGKQTRPDSGYMRPVLDPVGTVIGEVGDGSRKDIRNAVEAARSAARWARTSGHQRAQVLYYIAENLEARAAEFASRLDRMTGCGAEAATQEVALSVERLFLWGAWADKYDGQVHDTARRQFTFSVHEAIGTIGILCPDTRPLLAFVSTSFAAVAMGNTVIAVPSERHPLAATDLYQVLDTSDLPGGVLNIVTGAREALAETLADHDDLDALWHFGSAAGAAEVERRSIGNLKRTWCDHGHVRDWEDPDQGAGREFLRASVQVKNIWVPYGE